MNFATVIHSIQECLYREDARGRQLTLNLRGPRGPRTVPPKCTKGAPCGATCISRNLNCRIQGQQLATKPAVDQIAKLVKGDFAKTRGMGKGGGGGGGLSTTGIGSQRVAPDAETRKKMKTIGAKPAQKPIEPQPEPKKSRKRTQSPPKIKNFDQFSKEFPQLFSQVSNSQNYKGLVPLADLRDALKGRVSDQDFDKFVRQLQNQDIGYQLYEGRDTGDERLNKAGIKTALGTYRYLQGPYDQRVAKEKDEPYRSNFKTFAKDFDRVFDELDDEFDYKNMVPIYQIRRRFGDRVGRKEFDDYMMELQGQGKIQLHGSDFQGSPDEIRDSIVSPISGLRGFAIRRDKEKRKR